MNLFGSVEINFECRDLPVPNGGEAPECYEQSPAKIAMSQEPAEPSEHVHVGRRGGREWERRV